VLSLAAAWHCPEEKKGREGRCCPEEKTLRRRSVGCGALR